MHGDREHEESVLGFALHTWLDLHHAPAGAALAFAVSHS